MQEVTEAEFGKCKRKKLEKEAASSDVDGMFYFTVQVRIWFYAIVIAFCIPSSL